MSTSVVRLQAQLLRDAAIDEAFFREKNAKLNRKLRQRIGVAPGPYLVQPSGCRPYTRCGLSVDPANVDLNHI